MKTITAPSRSVSTDLGFPEKVLCINDSNPRPNILPNGSVKKGLVYHVTGRIVVKGEESFLILGFPAICPKIRRDVGFAAFRFRRVR